MEEKRKNKGNVPNLRFPGFEREWKTASIGECSSSLEYGMNSSATKFDGENKYIRITDIDDGSRKYKSHSPVSPEGILSEKYLVKENDILFVRTGADTGRSYCYDSNDGKLYFAGFLIRARINPIYNGNFIFAQTLTQKYNRWVKLMSMRSGQPGINSQEYSSFQFNIPTKEEQDKISLFLSKIDARIETQSKIIEELKSLKDAFIKSLFRKKLCFRDYKGKYFPNWQSKNLGDLTIFINTRNKKNEKFPVYSINNKKGFIPQGDQFEGVDSNSRGYDISIYKVIDKATFAYNPARINVGSIGYSGDLQNILISSLYVCFKTTTELDDAFLLQYVKMDYFNRQVLEYMEGGVRSYLFYENFSKISLPLPCLEEQIKIAKLLNSFDERVNNAFELLEKMKSQKKYLLNSLFI